MGEDECARKLVIIPKPLATHSKYTINLKLIRELSSGFKFCFKSLEIILNLLTKKHSSRTSEVRERAFGEQLSLGDKCPWGVGALGAIVVRDKCPWEAGTVGATIFGGRKGGGASVLEKQAPREQLSGE